MDIKRETIAINLYNGIINRKKGFEIKAVPKISRCIVERIYNLIFIRKYLFLDGKIHKFDPDYSMAHSW